MEYVKQITGRFKDGKREECLKIIATRIITTVQLVRVGWIAL